MNDSPAFVEYGLGIHDNLAGSSFPFDFQIDTGHDPIAVDPGLTLSPYTTTTPDSHFTTPSSVPLLSPGSSIEYFGDHRSSIGSLDTTIAPYEILASTAAPKGSIHNSGNNNHKPSKAAPGSASATAAYTAAPAPGPGPDPGPGPGPASDLGSASVAMMARTRKASGQGADASSSEAQPRTKKQKTTFSVQATGAAAKQEAQQQHQQQQQQQPSPPKRKSARRGAATKKEDAAQRSKNLERNRIAASKCRQKKKEWVLELEETKSGMELRHTNLRMEYFQLLDEVTRIKNHLMAHATCNDPNINFWIEKEALKYVERCMDPAQDRRPSIAPHASGSCTLPSPAESHRSHLESPPDKHEGINLDYMPDELLTGEAV
ncbi:bZIP transcription factor [Trichoderma cornu-damae]|uniref:BZIP transcription factor n=1 Tax=Trichoderma cornu-damae TaxID=654480 RepID=A0A9P8TXH2_9HYPO|nr:bZIP transcription factor [Trichoderma cornu-damae]